MFATIILAAILHRGSVLAPNPPATFHSPAHRVCIAIHRVRVHHHWRIVCTNWETVAPSPLPPSGVVHGTNLGRPVTF